MKIIGVYIIQSLKNGRYYVGSTQDFESRIKYHNEGRVPSTKHLRPWVLKVLLPCSSITLAKQSEFRLKKYKRRDILEKVILDKTFPWEYNASVV